MRAYYFDDLPGDQRLLHDSGRPVDESTLASLGVLHWSIPVEDWESRINDVAKERDYKNRDTINVTKDGLGDAYESKIKSFFEEYVAIFCLNTS
jgi:1,2-dihydroxy-3-keto-5-methylthiopentene dioxygenase